MALAAGGCSAANPLFNPANDEAVADTGAIAMSTGAGSTGEAGEDGDGGSSGVAETDSDPDIEMANCHPQVAALIDRCLRAAELSHETTSEPEQYWDEPTRDLLFPLACTDGFGDEGGYNSIDFFASLAPGHDRAPEAYFDVLCAGGGFPFCEDGLDKFESEMMPTCVSDYGVAQQFAPYTHEDLKTRQAIEDAIEAFENHVDPRRMEVLQYGHGMTPTSTGDAVRELLGNAVYAPEGDETIERYDDGLIADPTFQMWLDDVRNALGYEHRTWIVATYHDIETQLNLCMEQTRALIAVHHESRLVIKMTFPECTLEGG